MNEYVLLLEDDDQDEKLTVRSLRKAGVVNPIEVVRDGQQALDYLFGFTLSPVLWRKLPGAKSAGRVQSVCLRLIVEREMEIEAFKAQEYWTVKAVFRTPRGQEFEAGLVTLGGKKLQKFDLPTATAADLAVSACTSRTFSVSAVESKPATRNPWPPFMASTPQQEAGR